MKRINFGFKSAWKKIGQKLAINTILKLKIIKINENNFTLYFLPLHSTHVKESILLLHLTWNRLIHKDPNSRVNFYTVYKNAMKGWGSPVPMKGTWKSPLCTNKWKAEQKSKTLFGYVIESRTQGKLLPPRLERQTGEYRESQFTRRNSQKGTTTGTSAKIGKPEL